MPILRRFFMLAVVLSGVFVFSTTAHAAAVGDQKSFFVDPSFDIQNRTSLTATLKIMGSRSAIWVENAYFSTLSQSDKDTLVSSANNLAAQFDTNIYPKSTQTYGPPWEPGIDNDVHIVILLMQLKSGYSGYMNTGDEIPRAQNTTSNEHEMVYVNATLFPNQRLLDAVVGHEFTHVITFFAKEKLHNVEEDTWLNEARADYAPTLLGYDSPYSGSYLSSRVATFRANPSDSLTEWKNQSPDYGVVNLFAHYLADRFGVDLLQRSMSSSQVGIASLEEALRGEAGAPTFAEVYRSFTGAIWLNNPSAGQDYSFTNPDLSSTNLKITAPTASYSVLSGATVSGSQQAKDWSAQWLRFTGGASGKTLEVVLRADVPESIVVMTMSSSGNENAQTVFAPATGTTLRVDNFGSSIASVTLGVVLSGKTVNFSDSEPLHNYSFTAQLVQAASFSISQFTPATIVASLGAHVEVDGSNFSQGMSLSIDGQSVPLTVESATRLSFTAPAGLAGQKCLVFTHPSGSSLTDCTSVTYVAYAEGSLIRAANDYRVYIVKGAFIRHIVSSEIFNFYGHLSFAVVQVVAPEVIPQLTLSAWVRADGDVRVYETNDDGTKHWMNMTAQQFLSSGRSWEGVYIINTRERDWYRIGSDVLYQ